MDSPVAICNAALGWVGEQPISALDEEAAAESVAAQLCFQNYGAAVRAVLEERAWTFATGWEELAPAAAAPASPEFSKQFLLPPQVLRVLQCDDGSGTFDLEWKREGQYILADCATLRVRAIRLVEDPKLWTGNFALAVAYRLASVLAIPLAENRALQADLVQLYRAQVAQAGALDATQGRREPQRPGRSARARR